MIRVNASKLRDLVIGRKEPDAPTLNIRIKRNEEWNPRLWFRPFRRDSMVRFPLSGDQYYVSVNAAGKEAGYRRIPRKIRGKAARRADREARRARH